ncbi:MAG: hypothetical protein ISR76_05820 [Planctomycetes bacterium]|nr:hypothetical protein [Planctomycetota bacterium]MBL7008496.1 hypothetical protein [Planctomycetota bacterium]
MPRLRRNFATVLPLLWGACCVLGFRFPGDEYGLWAFGSVAGAWVFLLAGDISTTLYALPLLALAGMLTMWGAGRALDRLRVPWKLWIPSAVVIGALVVEAMLAGYPDLEQAVEKNGSLAAYLVFGLQVGGYGATLLGMVGVGIWRLLEQGRAPEGT